MNAMLKKKRASAALIFLLGGCRPVSAEECSNFEDQKTCENADVEPESSCHWLTVLNVGVDDIECEDPIRESGTCIGFRGTDQGCWAQDCAEMMGGGPDDAVAFHREREQGEVEIVLAPVCGPDPVGDWEACESDQPPQCACACGITNAGN